MKKEEILEQSRKENKKKDIYEIEMEYRGASYAAMSIIILAFIYFTYEIMLGKGSNPALYSIITIYNSILFGYKAIKIEKSRKLNTFTALLWGLLTILLVLEYFKVI